MSLEQLITEQALVIKREQASLWVAADRRSACASCRVKSGCGTSLLARLGSESVLVRALIPSSLESIDFTEGEEVEIAVDRYAFVKVSLVIYLLPLAGLLLGVITTGLLLGDESDLATASAAIMGLVAGGAFSRGLLKRWHNSELLQPVVLRKVLEKGEMPLTL